MFPALIMFAAIFGAAAVSTSQQSYIRLESTESTIEAGKRFTLNVYANAHVPVNAVDVTLKFDPKAVKVMEVDRGQSVLTIWTQDPIIQENSVILRGGTFKRGFIGEHKIASIDLLALSTGQSSLSATNVVLLAGDGKGTPVTVGQNDKSSVNLYIYDENTSLESIGVNVAIKIITDIDGDGKVSLKDISAFMAAWANKDVSYDFNGDGKMTFRDFSIILADFFFK
ncbi:hypothetical protein H6784_00520 [Candidatus Nomurabacteria bacterium]|nr:hypothetical protein [Candidatus Kaiserbacteria bacterium]MCB9813877.1 hypothetical protein [Candidatus Nomurabacteria bacterium]